MGKRGAQTLPVSHTKEENVSINSCARRLTGGKSSVLINDAKITLFFDANVSFVGGCEPTAEQQKNRNLAK